MGGAKPAGALASEPAEPAVEVRQVIEPGTKAHLYHREVRFEQEATGLAHPELSKVVDKGLADRLPEEAAEGLRGHAGNIGRLWLGQPAMIALVDKGADPVDPPEVPLPI